MNGIDSSTVAPASGPRFKAADGIRGFAAVGVLTAHSAILLAVPGYAAHPLVRVWVSLGIHGLTMFFVLSGFLLYRPFVSSIVNHRPLPSIRAFFRNRALRIWPAYLVVFCLSSFVVGVALLSPAEGGHLDPIVGHVGYLTDPLLIVLNLTLTQGLVPAGVLTGLSVSWSLVVEVSFYMLLPVLAWIGIRSARRLGGARGALVPCILFLVVGLVTRLITGLWVYSDGPDGVTLNQSGETWSAVVFRSVFTMADLFSIGMLVAVASVMVMRPGVSGWSLRTTRRIAGTATGFGVLCASVAYASGDDRITTTPMGLALGGILALLVLPGASRPIAAFGSLLESPVPRWLGQCSYSVYLIHMPVCLFILVHAPALQYDNLPQFALVLVLVCAVTLPLAGLSYRFVEYPALRRKTRTVAAQGDEPGIGGAMAGGAKPVPKPPMPSP